MHQAQCYTTSGSESQKATLNVEVGGVQETWEGKGGKKEGGEVRGENGVIAKQSIPTKCAGGGIHLPHPHLNLQGMLLIPSMSGS